VAQFDRRAHPRRQALEEVAERGIVARLVRRQLDEQDAALAVELVPACHDSLDPDLWRLSRPGRRLTPAYGWESLRGG